MSKEIKSRYEFKNIGPDNWQCPDEQSLLWMRMTGYARTSEEWVTFFMRPALHDTVPKDIVTLYETARGSAVYGWFFYPAVTLAAEQCWRVIETGVRLRCDQVGISTKRIGRDGKQMDTKFSENIAALLKNNFIGKEHARRLNSLRSLRNSTSHPVHQMILDPGQSQGIFEFGSDFLNTLFA